MLLSEGWLLLHDKVSYTNTINNVLCISEYITLMVGGNSSGKTVLTQLCPRMMRNFNNLCVIILETILVFGLAELYGLLDQIFSDYHLNSFTFINVASGWLCFVMCYYVYHYVCIVSLCVFACISTCTLGILKTYLK